ncbi:PPA1309 family protein [Propioniciclava sp.]|uniref:PPA1309 family protein n=1 Tax=Propioniciclava sp. TaxID=2038686 RepID=UPI002618E1EC|nr:PPA1309 family protein [Propioniciclava sp.]
MSTDALVAALAEIERHVAHAGWDTPARLFALVPTAELLAAERSLAGQLAAPTAPDALSSIEQDGFHAGDDVVDALARISWPPTVFGAALVLERLFLPAGLEADLPDDPDAAAAAVAAHPARQDVRVVVGVTRDGAHHGLARLKSHPEDLLAAPDLVPGLADALAQTLHD